MSKHLRLGRWTLAVVIAAVVAVAGLTTAVVALTNGNGSNVPLKTTDAAAVVLDPGVNETFTPSDSAPSNATTLLTEAQARKAGESSGLPPYATAQTGYLTFPVGPGDPDAYHAKAAYSYAFTWANCEPAILAAPPAGATATANPDQLARCTQWLIVDAQTGKILDITWSK